ncbi:Uncharacterised protein [Bordetella ansorpii]|uniref:DUF4351 domain-containing protein n=1 Tax=Bordetella ansorpii TaxID=288768 RepID=A0A157SBQ5_9BORD|nr:DUF4351 domain-containing protein [Bordetella ansorpii]SAI67870.1 Uncharacterised protein [Bordetella ansorpii]
MLYDTVKGWTQDWLRQGMQQGRHALLRQQLVHRFGPLSADVEQRLKQAPSPDLDRWALSMLSASNLQDVFAEPAA